MLRVQDDGTVGWASRRLPTLLAAAARATLWLAVLAWVVIALVGRR